MKDTDRAAPIIAVVEGWGVAKAIQDAGADTISVYDRKDAKLALTYADGIILTGGGDVNPKRYGEKEGRTTYGVNHRRDELEFWLVKKAKERGIPIMGICRGSQVLNVAHGGTLIQEIAENPNVVDHWGVDMWVKLSQTSRVAERLQTAILRSSHYHHQAVREIGKGLRAIAWAHDGTVEAIESMPDSPHYVLGVQFHPEMDYVWDTDAEEIFAFFTWDVCARFSAGRKTDANARIGMIQSERRKHAVVQYDYTAGSVVTRKGSEDRKSSYYFEKSDWEYEEWLKEHAPFARITADPFDDVEDEDDRMYRYLTSNSYARQEDCDGMCIDGQCVTPTDCSQYGECGALAVANVAGRAKEDEAICAAVVAQKRGSKRGESRP